MHILKPYDINIFGEHIFKKSQVKSSLIQPYGCPYEKRGVSTDTEGERELQQRKDTRRSDDP